MADKEPITTHEGASESVPGSFDAFARLRSSRWLSPICAVLALLPIIAFLCLIGFPKYAMTPDDQAQALYASGRIFGFGPTSLMLYTLYPVSAPLSMLYQTMPNVPWYPSFLLILTWISFAIGLDTAVRSRLRNTAAACSLIVLISLEVLSLFYFTYTITAFLGTAAGLMLLINHAAFTRENRLRVSDVCGVLLIALGYSLRPESGLAAIAIFAPFALWVLVRNRCLGSILRGVAAIACVGLCATVGQIAYDTTPGWEGFSDYLAAGRQVMDSPVMSVESIQAAAPELSENDVKTMYNWDGNDIGYFSTDLFQKAGKAVSRYNLANFLDSFTAKTTYMLIGLAVGIAILTWMIARDIRGDKATFVLAFGIAFMLMASYGIIIMRARPRLHVVIPLATIAFFALMSFAHAPASTASGKRFSLARGNRRSWLTVGATVAVCAVVLAGFYLKTVKPSRSLFTHPTVLAMTEYVEDHPNTLFYSRTTPILFHKYDALSFETWKQPENLLAVGSWQSGAAPWRAYCERKGLDPEMTLLELLNRDDMLAILAPKSAKYLKTYLEERTGRPVKRTLLEDLGNGVTDPTQHVCVYRFTYAD